jgi:two-component system NarL family sensor kinase
MMSWLQQVIRQQPDPSETIQKIFQFIVRSAVAMNVCMLLISLGMAYLLVGIVVEGPLTKVAKEHTRHRVEVMATALETLVPPGTVFGPKMDQKLQERITSLIREGKQSNDSVYFILFHIDGTVIAQGTEPENPGAFRRYATDADGVHHILLLSEAASRGGGFVQYKWKKPGGRGPSQKIAYAKMLSGGAWWIASGVYLDDIAKVRDEILYEQGFYLSVVASVLFFLLSVGYRVGNNMGHEIAQPVVEELKALAKVTDETRRIHAGVLHNLVGRLTVVLKDKLWEMADAVDATKRHVLKQEASGIIDDFDGTCQKLEDDIYPRVVQDYGVGALTQLVEEELEGRKIPHVTLSIDASVPRSDNGRECALYLIAQGLLQNVLKSAQATQVRIDLTGQGKNVMLTVEDNGTGFDADSMAERKLSAHTRYGIPWMKAQVKVYGGRITFTSVLGQGTTVTVSLPWLSQRESQSRS